MNKKELIKTTLIKMGYNPQIDNDGDIALTYQMKKLYVITSDNEDDQYVTALLPQFNELGREEVMVALVTCNKVTRELKMAKVYLDPNLQNVSASCEFFYTDEASLENALSHALRVLGVVRSVYRREKENLSDEK